MSIREELLEVTELKARKKETDASLIKRLVIKAEGVDEDAWEGLTTETQEFYNSVVEAAKEHSGGSLADLDKEHVPAFPDEKEEEEEEQQEDLPLEASEESEEDHEESEGEEVVATKAKKAALKKTAARKASKKNGDGGEKTVSMRRRLRQMIIRKPSISLEDLMKSLGDEGYKVTPMTVGSMRSSTRDILKLLVEAGKLEVQL